MKLLFIEMILVTAMSAFGAVVVVLRSRSKERKLLDHLYKMLQQAIDGSFNEKIFDESRLSAVETEMVHYLSGCQVSAKNLQGERDKIKQLISDISHQTKTPVANILLYAQLLSEKELPPETMECVTALTSQAEKLNFLISTLVKASRLETGIIAVVPQKEEVNRLIEETITQAMPKARIKKITLVRDNCSAEALFDMKWTVEALYNLIDNAIKYAPENSNIQVSVKPYELFVCIDVKDEGIGISEEEIPKIFNRFYRSQEVNSKEGVGIGLYLARQIVTSEGGYIKVTSQKGKGSTFSIFLPAA